MGVVKGDREEGVGEEGEVCSVGTFHGGEGGVGVHGMRGRIEMWLHRSRVPRRRGRDPSMVGRTMWFSERVTHFGLVGWEGERSDNVIHNIHTHMFTYSHAHILTCSHAHILTLTHTHTLTYSHTHTLTLTHSH